MSRSEPPPEGVGEYTSSVLLGAPVSFGRGRPSPDQVRDIAAELAGWTSGELPGQVTEQLTAWPPGAPMASDQPAAGAWFRVAVTRSLFFLQLAGSQLRPSLP